jgi:general secretion pathway protein G
MVKNLLGYTLIELLVVLAIIALLLTISAPRLDSYLDQARETVLAENLKSMRIAIDAYTADKGPTLTSMEALVASKYLRSIPSDPITGRADTWTPVLSLTGTANIIVDVRSGALGQASTGEPFADF